MKRLINFSAVAILVIMSSVSCTKLEYVDNSSAPVEIIGTPLDDGLISIRVTVASDGFKSSLGDSDTVSTEKYLRTTYQAISVPNVTIVNWQWTFNENNAKSNGSTVEFWHSLDPGSITSVVLVGVEANGTAHIATKWVKIVYSLDGMPGFVMVSKTPVEGGSFNYLFAAHKKGMQGTKGPYGYTGNTMSPTWSIMPLAVTDTNYNFVSGALIAAPMGDIGKYVAIRVTLAPGEYEIHVGHIVSSANLIWGNFWSWFDNGKFTVNSNGDLTSLNSEGLPGASGDEGVNAVIRKDILFNSVIVYTKHTAAFTKGFIQLQKADGTWLAPQAETAVSGSPNWGKVEILFPSFPIPQYLVFRFGSNIDTPYIFSTNMPASGYWDNIFQVLKIKIITM